MNVFIACVTEFDHMNFLDSWGVIDPIKKLICYMIDDATTYVILNTPDSYALLSRVLPQIPFITKSTIKQNWNYMR
jgi:hypothetical protein